MQTLLGIDVGASGIKGALVDLKNGKLSGERFRVATPQPATPAAMAAAFAEIVEFFGYKGPVGCGFPSIVKNGVCQSAANIDASVNAAGGFVDPSNGDILTAGNAFIDAAGVPLAGRRKF